MTTKGSGDGRARTGDKRGTTRRDEVADPRVERKLGSRTDDVERYWDVSRCLGCAWVGEHIRACGGWPLAAEE